MAAPGPDASQVHARVATPGAGWAGCHACACTSCAPSLNGRYALGRTGEGCPAGSGAPACSPSHRSGQNSSARAQLCWLVCLGQQDRTRGQCLLSTRSTSAGTPGGHAGQGCHTCAARAGGPATRLGSAGCRAKAAGRAAAQHSQGYEGDPQNGAGRQAVAAHLHPARGLPAARLDSEQVELGQQKGAGKAVLSSMPALPGRAAVPFQQAGRAAVPASAPPKHASVPPPAPPLPQLWRPSHLAVPVAATGCRRMASFSTAFR